MIEAIAKEDVRQLIETGKHLFWRGESVASRRKSHVMRSAQSGHER